VARWARTLPAAIRGRRDQATARALLLGVALLVLLPGGSSARSDATAALVTLRLMPAGDGVVTAKRADGTESTCDSTDVIAQSGPCVFEFEQGSGVTLTAAAKQELGSTFVRWTYPGCEGLNPCEITVAENFDTLVALFTPLKLEVHITGSGIVSFDGTDPPCVSAPPADDPGAETVCIISRPAESAAVLTATGDHTWGRGCEPDGANPSSANCVVYMTSIRTFAIVGFDGAELPGLPFDLAARIRVLRSGSGSGHVTGSGDAELGDGWLIDCGSMCGTDFVLGHQQRLTLKAEGNPGSRFVRWSGACSTEAVCTFTAGAVPVIRASFDSLASPPGPSPPPPRPPPASSDPLRPPKAFTVQVGKIAAVGRRASRAVVLRVAVDRASKATVRSYANERRSRSEASRFRSAQLTSASSFLAASNPARTALHYESWAVPARSGHSAGRVASPARDRQ
jgi:hypothetical protein